MRQLRPATELGDFLDNKVPHRDRVGSPRQPPPDDGGKLIDQSDQPKSARRPSSPFNNGLTEVLICKDGTENNNRLKAVDETNETQSRWERERERESARARCFENNRRRRLKPVRRILATVGDYIIR